MSKQLTVKQAIDQGYTMCGEKPCDRFQRLLNISTDLDEDRFAKKLFLAENEPYHVSFWENEIAEIIADHAYNKVGDETGDDDPQWAYDDVLKLCCDDLTKKVNAALAGHDYYNLTDIELVP